MVDTPILDLGFFADRNVIKLTMHAAIKNGKRFILLNMFLPQIDPNAMLAYAGNPKTFRYSMHEIRGIIANGLKHQFFPDKPQTINSINRTVVDFCLANSHAQLISFMVQSATDIRPSILNEQQMEALIDQTVEELGAKDTDDMTYRQYLDSLRAAKKTVILFHFISAQQMTLWGDYLEVIHSNPILIRNQFYSLLSRIIVTPDPAMALAEQITPIALAEIKKLSPDATIGISFNMKGILVQAVPDEVLEATIAAMDAQDPNPPMPKVKN